MDPFLVSWSAKEKAMLEAASQRGIVVVSFAGCTLKVLDGCDAGGAYGFKRLVANRDIVEIDSESELYRELPLGVAALKGALRNRTKVVLNAVVVGQYAADGEPMKLRGDCAGATHYVRVLTVGAYSLTAPSSAPGARRDSMEVLRQGGDPDACAANADGEACYGMLQLGLEPLGEQADGRERAGFGAGLGGTGRVPTVSVAGDVSLAAGGDAALVKKVQDADRQEHDATLNSEQKRAAWMEVVNYAPIHPYREQAQRRAEEWGAVAVAEAQRARKALVVCDSYVQDAARLKQLVGPADDVMQAVKAAAYRREYERAYAPFKSMLADCDGGRARAAEPWVGQALARSAEEQRTKDQSSDDEERSFALMASKSAASEADLGAGTRVWKASLEITGGVLTVAGATFLGVAFYDARKAKDNCSGSLCPGANKGTANAARTFGNFGLAGVGTGLVLLVGGYLWPSPKAASPAPEKTGSWRLIPGPGQAGLGTQMSF